jgi:hypothetical protein
MCGHISTTTEKVICSGSILPSNVVFESLQMTRSSGSRTITDIHYQQWVFTLEPLLILILKPKFQVSSYSKITYIIHIQAHTQFSYNSHIEAHIYSYMIMFMHYIMYIKFTYSYKFNI